MGATIGECGARKWTPLATATLLIGANLPDVDALTYFGDHVTALGFRRGWTHGILAVAVWPFLLAGAMWLYDAMVRLRRPGTGSNQVRLGPLLGLAFLAVASHPLLDFLNTYGVRLLMPFSHRWFYGDTLFIIDPWVWIVLAAGIVTGRVLGRRADPAAPIPARAFVPARIAGGLVVVYVAAMGISGALARHDVATYMSDVRHFQNVRVMVAPEPLDPLRRELVLGIAGGYEIGTWDWTRSPHMGGPWVQIESDSSGPAQREALRSPRARTFLSWSRLPVVTGVGADGCPAAHVCLRDARYYRQPWAEVALPVAAAVSSTGPRSPTPDPGLQGAHP